MIGYGKPRLPEKDGKQKHRAKSHNQNVSYGNRHHRSLKGLNRNWKESNRSGRPVFHHNR